MADLPKSDDVERRWTIALWSNGEAFVQGPPTDPPKELGLTGLDWVEAARVEVVEAKPTDEKLILSDDQGLGGVLNGSPPRSDDRRWVAHVCVVPDCEHVEIDRSRNHAQYLCYRHEPPQPLRPIVLGVVDHGDLAWARAAREAATHGRWRRASQHFEPDGEGHEFLTAPFSGEDWPGWPWAVTGEYAPAPPLGRADEDVPAFSTQEVPDVG